ncbi:MAG: hypothetical protein PVH67_12855 [Desulfobacterales bacterium]|jgi:hypothetical protein
MKRVQLLKLLFFFTPEETRWTENSRLKFFIVQKKRNMSSLSIKAIFWVAISIICALMMGQLN